MKQTKQVSVAVHALTSSLQNSYAKFEIAENVSRLSFFYLKIGWEYGFSSYNYDFIG